MKALNIIVECIDDKFCYTTKTGKRRRTRRIRVPKIGCLYEVIGYHTIFMDGHDRVFYYLREFPDGSSWHCSFFREVEINIEEAKEVLAKQVDIYQEIEVCV